MVARGIEVGVYGGLCHLMLWYKSKQDQIHERRNERRQESNLILVILPQRQWNDCLFGLLYWRDIFDPPEQY